MDEIMNTTVKYTKSLKSFAYTDNVSEDAYEIIISDQNLNGNHTFNCMVTTPRHSFIEVLGWNLTEIVIYQDWIRYYSPLLILRNSKNEEIEIKIPERFSRTRNIDGFKFQRRFSEMQDFIDYVNANFNSFDEFLKHEAEKDEYYKEAISKISNIDDAISAYLDLKDKKSKLSSEVMYLIEYKISEVFSEYIKKED